MKTLLFLLFVFAIGQSHVKYFLLLIFNLKLLFVFFFHLKLSFCASLENSSIRNDEPIHVETGKNPHLNREAERMIGYLNLLANMTLEEATAFTVFKQSVHKDMRPVEMLQLHVGLKQKSCVVQKK